MEIGFFALIALLLGVSIWKAKNVFFFFPALFALYLWKISFLGVPWNFLEILVYAFFVVWLLKMLIFQRKHFGEFIKDECTISSPLLLWGLILVLTLVGLFFVPKQIVFETGIAATPEELFATQRILLGIIKTWMIPSWIFLLLVRFFVKHKVHKHKLLLSYAIGATVVAFMSMFLKYAMGITDTIDDRLGGIFVSANYLAFYVIPALLYVVVALVQKEVVFSTVLAQRRYRILLWMMLPILLITVILVKSYAGWISTLLCLTLFAFAHCSKKQLIVLMVVCVLTMGGILSFEMGTKKFTTFFETRSQSSTSTRLEVYRVSMDLLKNNWLMGIGAGQYEVQYKLKAVSVLGKTPYEWVMLHPHNLYLSLWLSLGIFGLLVFLLMLWDAVRAFLLTKQWIFFLPLLYLLLHGMVDTPFWKMDMIFLFVMLYMVNSRDPIPTDSRCSR